MKLVGISLQRIRSHSSLTLKLDSQVTIIIGPNASGKTTIAEAIFFLATGESFRATKVDEMIQFGAELGRVQAKISTAEPAKVGESAKPSEHTKSSIETTTDNIEIILTRGTVQGQKTAKRLFSVNGVRRPKKKAIGLLAAVVFRPEDMRLVEGSPTRRRQFMDVPLALMNRSYHQSLHTYNQTLIRRNKLLTKVREGEQPRSSLQFWTLSMIKHGQVLQEQRREFLQSFGGVTFELPYTVEYQPSVMSAERMADYADREIAAGHTLIGPHKDDLIVKLEKLVTHGGGEKFDKVNVALYGSRGEQRLAVLWLKFCELKYLDSHTDAKPILLLDDILSELDQKSRRVVIDLLAEYQTVITSAHPSVVTEINQKIDPKDSQLISLSAPALQ